MTTLTSPLAPATSPARTPQFSGAATLNASHPAGAFLQRLIAAPPSARIAMAMGELASTMDAAAPVGQSLAVGVGAIEAGHHLGITAAALTALWARWGRSACVIDLGTGPGSLGGALTGSVPDLTTACDLAASGQSVAVSRLHANLANAGAIVAGKADVLGLISTGRLAQLVKALQRDFDRVVIAAPRLDTGFPFLSLFGFCDRLALALVRGHSRGGPLREVGEQAVRAGLPALDAIWFD